mmetsp:Transcript_9105/g.21805  ORF Transcript_9105/g.21805 Transcript_9105/m.21805 type:complete len:265 (+) Transcript_9105:312-1106(+)
MPGCWPAWAPCGRAPAAPGIGGRAAPGTPPGAPIPLPIIIPGIPLPGIIPGMPGRMPGKGIMPGRGPIIPFPPKGIMPFAPGIIPGIPNGIMPGRGIPAMAPPGGIPGIPGRIPGIPPGMPGLIYIGAGPPPLPPIGPPGPMAPGVRKRCCSRANRASRRSARPTYNGLSCTFFKCISVTALVASSGWAKQTNPNPLDLPASSRITRTDVVVPNGANNSFSCSSSMESSKFLMYRFTPCGVFLEGSNFLFNSDWRSALDCARWQ